jgi:hypothetical protein
MLLSTLETRVLPRLANDVVVAATKVGAGRLAGEQASNFLFPFMPGYPQDPRIDLTRQPQPANTAAGRPAGRSAGSFTGASRRTGRGHSWPYARTRCPGQ